MPNPLLSRRQFHQASVAAGTMTLTSGVVAGSQTTQKDKYIAMHTHVGTFYFGKELTADELVRMMDKHGIEKACVLPLVSPESTPYLQPTEGALAAAKAHSDRLIAFCCLDARV